MTQQQTKNPVLTGPPTQEQIDTLGELFVDREHGLTLDLLAQRSSTLLDAGFTLRYLRDCPKKVLRDPR